MHTTCLKPSFAFAWFDHVSPQTMTISPSGLLRTSLDMSEHQLLSYRVALACLLNASFRSYAFEYGHLLKGCLQIQLIFSGSVESENVPPGEEMVPGSPCLPQGLTHHLRVLLLHAHGQVRASRVRETKEQEREEFDGNSLSFLFFLQNSG